MIGIIGAMDEEINKFIEHSEKIKDIEWNKFVFYHAKLFGKEVVMVKSGVGKVMAAMVTQKLITEFKPKEIIFTGVAGALNKELDLGDVVVSRDCIQHDFDVTALGYPRGAILYTDYKEFPADFDLIKKGLSCKLEKHKIVLGRILTGDQFMTRKDINSHSYLTDELKGDAVEMEGASVAMVCTINKIPYVVVRTISDKADGSAAADFTAFLAVAADNSFHILKTLLD
ncbi:MAG: 5'-methylthioadenosine/adenosylhomocysteine nucleosidase [Candidatus Woesearchaeota archaeon]